MVSWFQACRNVLAHVTVTNRTEPPIIIPYGRHSYGPQPQLVGVNVPERREMISKKSAGSKIGNFCSIASGLRFTFLDKHNYDWASTYPFYVFYDKWRFDLLPFYRKGKLDPSAFKANPIIVENDVWIAVNVTIKEGVTVGNGAVIAMESVVTKDIPPYAVVGGSPAKIIKYRFNPEQIEDLLSIAWWNWADEKIRRFVPLMMSEDIDAFITSAKKSTEQPVAVNTYEKLKQPMAVVA
jgi:acetyltransferase-like isoleucine patch superfamily enzyme